MTICCLSCCALCVYYCVMYALIDVFSGSSVFDCSITCVLRVVMHAMFLWTSCWRFRYVYTCCDYACFINPFNHVSVVIRWFHYSFMSSFIMYVWCLFLIFNCILVFCGPCLHDCLHTYLLIYFRELLPSPTLHPHGNWSTTCEHDCTNKLIPAQCSKRAACGWKTLYLSNYIWYIKTHPNWCVHVT